MATGVFSDKSVPGGIVHNPASPYAREMAKWEMDYSPYGPPGRPRHQTPFQEYPAMFYKMARAKFNGEFVTEHYQLAADVNEAIRLEGLGYRNGQVAAIEYVVALEQSMATAAAERAYSDRNMSENAQAEIALAESATSQHLAEVPVTPIRRRGRPAKVPTTE